MGAEVSSFEGFEQERHTKLSLSLCGSFRCMSSASAMFSQSSAQLVRPNLGFMVSPSQKASIASSSLPRFLRMESQSQSQPRQSISCASSPSSNLSQANSSSLIESGQLWDYIQLEMESHFFIELLMMVSSSFFFGSLKIVFLCDQLALEKLRE